MTATLNVALHPGESVTIGSTELHRIEGGRLRLTAGSRSYEVTERIFEILVDGAVSEHVHRMDDEPHEVWCHRPTHARAEAEAVPGNRVGCTGREHVVTLSGHEYGSYWFQLRNGEARLATEWPGLVLVEWSIDQVRAAYRVALAFGASPDVDQVTTMLGDALDEYHGGDGWRDTF